MRVGVGGCSAALMQACADEDLPESKKDTGRTGPLGLATSKVRRVKNVSASGAPSRCAERSSLEQGPAGAGVSATADGVSEQWRASGLRCVCAVPSSHRCAGSALVKRS